MHSSLLATGPAFILPGELGLWLSCLPGLSSLCSPTRPHAPAPSASERKDMEKRTCFLWRWLGSCKRKGERFAHHLGQTSTNHCRPGQGPFEGEAWEGKRITAMLRPVPEPHLQESPAEGQEPATTAHRAASLPSADGILRTTCSRRKPRIIMLPTRMSPFCHREADHPQECSNVRKCICFCFSKPLF